jgi:hypothetical protein
VIRPCLAGSFEYGAPGSMFERLGQLWLHTSVNRFVSRTSPVYGIPCSGPSAPIRGTGRTPVLHHRARLPQSDDKICPAQHVVLGTDESIRGSFLFSSSQFVLTQSNARVSSQSQSCAREKKLEPVQSCSQMHIRTIAVYNARAPPNATPSKDADSSLQLAYP